MSELIVITYPDPDLAGEVNAVVRRLQAAHVLDLEDFVYVRRDESGEIALYQSGMRPLQGAARGIFWGTLVGQLFHSPLIGAGLGAATGAIADKIRDCGIDDSFIRELSTKLPRGSSATFALVRKATLDKVLPEISRFGGTILHTSLSDAVEAELQAALSEGHRKAEALATAERRSHHSRVRRVIDRRK